MIARLLLAGLLAAGLAGCSRRAVPPPPVPRYVVGAGYQAGGTWFYPREDFRYVATGLAVIDPASSGRTADGEAVDPTAMTAAHPTLQLPSIARVTNLETGLQVLVRVNERGPGTPHRLIALSRRAASLLGMGAAAAPVRVEVDEAMSLALREQLQGGPRLAVSAAPRGAVTAEALAPPAGIGQSARGRTARTAAVTETAEPQAMTVPERLPETAQRVAAMAPPLMIHAGSFGQAAYARQVSARLAAIGARAEREGAGRSRVVAGPFRSVAEADAALDLALRAGVTDARIVAE